MSVVIKINVFASICVAILSHPTPNDNDSRLNLTPYIEEGQLDKARDLSAVDPTLMAQVKSHAAYINVNKTGDWNTFFWYFPVEEAAHKPWVIWLQGGPGGSSMYGLFQEIGPLQIVNGKAEKMPITWGSDYSLLFIDNPVNTGFSYGKGYASNQDMVGESLLTFIQQFLTVFSELRTAPLFIAGESYAGKYIPAFAHYIHEHKDEKRPINLRGLSMGDGWTDPPTLLHYTEYAVALGLMSRAQTKRLHQMEEAARAAWNNGDITKYKMLADFVEDFAVGTSLFDVYNILKNRGQALVDKDMTLYLNQFHVQKAIHVGNINYKPFSSDVYNHMLDDIYLSVKPWLEDLLLYYPVMSYSGQLDFLVSYQAQLNTVHSLNWPGKEQYESAERTALVDPDDSTNVLGYVQEGGNLTDVMIRGAGHMVPQDQPHAAKVLIDMFINKHKGI